MSIAATQATPAATWTGRILSGLVIAFLVLDAGMKLVPLQPVMEAMRDLGFPEAAAMARGLGMLLLACTILYAVPKTSVLGAVLLTGYLGGAIAVHLRLGHPWFSHVLFGAYIGMAAWAGLFARRAPLRALLLP
ncbi:MAG: DoxX family protein [Proteobacteria bacterium]|nr:DoxX family protein [Pseudomonadota bacterium]